MYEGADLSAADGTGAAGAEDNFVRCVESATREIYDMESSLVHTEKAVSPDVGQVFALCNWHCDYGYRVMPSRSSVDANEVCWNRTRGSRRDLREKKESIAGAGTGY